MLTMETIIERTLHDIDYTWDSQERTVAPHIREKAKLAFLEWTAELKPSQRNLYLDYRNAIQQLGDRGLPTSNLSAETWLNAATEEDRKPKLRIVR